MPRVKVNGWRFVYRRAGKGPDVVMLPGAARAPVSRPLFDALSANFRVTLYRSRGGDKAAYGSADAADDLRGLHEKLGFSKSFLVAQQDAATVALHTAVLYPDIVAGLILIEPCLHDARMDAPGKTGSGLTTRRILMIEHPLVVLCSPKSPGLNLCKFLASNLTRCNLIASSEDPVRSAARIHEQVVEMAGANPVVPAAGGRSSRIFAHGVHCRLAPDSGDGHAMTRWVTRLSAWGL